MHRKRVTSELHDSYFRLMTIKHSISKIEWASNDYITQWSSTSQELPVESDGQLSCRQLERRCDRESHTRPKGPSGALMNWGPEKMLEHQKNEKDTTLTAMTVGVKILQLCSISSSLSQYNPTQTFRTLTNKVRGKNIVKEVFLRLYPACVFIIASVCIQHIYMYISAWTCRWQCNSMSR